jgi:type VI secretion system protein ImpJ
MKLGSSGRVDEIFQMGQMGLRFAHSPRPPRALPSLAGLVYFQVDRQTQLQEWQAVQKSLTIALRLNMHLIVGDIQGQRVVRIRNQGQTTPLQFTLFVVSQETTG